MSEAECMICCSKWNATTRKKIMCLHCHKVTCRECVQRYLLETVNYASCMHCKVAWNMEFLQSILSNSWLMKEYRLRRNELLWERERARMPEMIPMVERHRYRRRIQADMDEMRKELEEYTIRMTKRIENIQRILWQDEYIPEEIYDEMKELIMQDDEERVQSMLIAYNPRMMVNQENEKKKKETAFIHGCPSADCNGFLSSKYKCMLCNRRYCKDCLVEKQENVEHQCDEDVKATVASIRKESKPCPGCGEMISKVDGCDQMWCTQCKVFFSWNTGQQIKADFLHNPHYLNWRRENRERYRLGNEQPVRECNRRVPLTDRELDLYFYQRHPPAWDPVRKHWVTYLCHEVTDYAHKWTRLIRELMDNVYRALSDDLREQNTDPRDIRLKYLLGDITEEDFRKKITIIERQFQYKLEIQQVWDMIRDVSVDLCDNIRTHNNRLDDVYMKELKEQISQVIHQANQAWIQIGLRYRIRVPHIVENSLKVMNNVDVKSYRI